MSPCSLALVCWRSPIVILGCHVSFVALVLFLMKNPIANNVDPDQIPHYVASDLSLHCLPMTLLQVSR